MVKGLSAKDKQYIKVHMAELSPGYKEFLVCLQEYIEKSYRFKGVKDKEYIFELHYTCRSKSEFNNPNFAYTVFEAIHKDEEFYQDFVDNVRLFHVNFRNHETLSYHMMRILEIDTEFKLDFEVLGKPLSYKDIVGVMMDNLTELDGSIGDIPISSKTRMIYHYKGKTKQIDLLLGDVMEYLAEAHKIFISWAHAIPASTLIKNSNGISKFTIDQERRGMTTDLRKKILKRDNYACRICGSHTDLQVDHIVPVSRGGKTVDWNLVTLCRKCNMDKSNKIKLLDVS